MFLAEVILSDNYLLPCHPVDMLHIRLGLHKSRQFLTIFVFMPITGLDLSNIIDQKTDQAYTGYNDATKKQRILNEALNKSIEKKVATNDRIQVQDDLFGIFKTNVVYTPTTNQISLIPAGAGITDYHHLMNLKVKFTEQFDDVYLTGASNTSTIRITTNSDINLRTGERIVISGVTGNTNANGTRYVKRMRPDFYELYSDVNLNTPIVGNGVYSGTTGQIYRVWYNDAKDMHSNRKFSKLNAPTIADPYYEIADTVLKVYPLTKVADEITIDYISLPYVPQIGENSVDLLATYSERFIYFLADETARLVGMYMRDDNLMNQEQVEIIQQP